MNQTLAAVTLWMIVAYLRRRRSNPWVGAVPAAIMTYVCASYVFVSPLMCGMEHRAAAYAAGGAATLAVCAIMYAKSKRDAKNRA